MALQSLCSDFRRDLETRLADNSKILVGFSGGLDSSLLLYATCKAFPDRHLRAIHCNHGQSIQSEAWFQLAQQRSGELGVELLYEKLDLPAGATENQARQARYAAFARHMTEDSVLLLGHHADDQIETMLLRLLRGTGLKGVLAMPHSREFQAGILVRPLLRYTKEQLETYASEAGLQWVEDKGNRDDCHDRNYLRNRILPLIRDRWPHTHASVLKTLDNLSEEQSCLSDYAQFLAEQVDVQKEAYGQSIDLGKLGLINIRGQRLVLRYLLYRRELRQPNGRELKEIARLIYARPDASPKYLFADSELRRYGGRLYFLSLPNGITREVMENRSLSWDGREPLQIEGLGRLVLLSGSAGQFEVSFCRQGARAKPVSRKHSQSVKKLFQEHRIEPWLRASTPLIYLDRVLVSIGDCIPCSEHRFSLLRDRATDDPAVRRARS